VFYLTLLVNESALFAFDLETGEQWKVIS